jgi:prevent-host-death family protein
MSETRISIGRIKRDISELLNRLTFRRERIVLTSRGQPKAVSVSLEDYERIQQAEEQAQLINWKAWLARNEAVAGRIRAERGGKLLEVDAILAETRADLAQRHHYLAQPRKDGPP